MKVLFQTVILVFLVNSAFCQLPSHFILGKQAFEGVQIYDAIQDNEKNYWFTTNQGLFFYDGYVFEKVESEEMLSQSLFNLRKDSNGIIYCFNLQNQIFKIEDRSIELIHTIPKEQSAHNIFLEVGLNNRIQIQTIGITSIEENGNIHFLKSDIFHEDLKPISFSVLNDGSLISSARNEIVRIKNGKTNCIPIELGIGGTPSSITITNWIPFRNKIYGVDQNSMTLYLFDPLKNSIKFVRELLPELKGTTLRTYLVNDQIWIAGRMNGIYVFDMNFQPLYHGRPIFKKHFISDVCTDHEQNILLSTFNEGIIVIPDISLNNIQLPSDQKIASFESDGKNTLFIGTDQGNIYTFTIDQSILNLIYSSESRRSIETLQYWKENRVLLHTVKSGFHLSDWNGKTLTRTKFKENSLKDAVFLDENIGYLAFNYGVSKVEKKKNDYTVTYQKDLSQRAYCITSNKKSGSIYAGLSDGFYILSKDDQLEKVKLQGKSVYANAMNSKNGMVCIGTRKNGVLIYRHDELVKRIPFKESISQVSFKHDKILFLAKSGLYSCETFSAEPVKMNMGVGSSNINFFLSANDLVFYTNSSTIGFMNLKKLSTIHVNLPIHISSFEVNDTPTNLRSFDYGKNKYMFRFNVSTLKHRKSTKYRYKLIGHNNNWQYLDYEDNSASFNGLLPGKYAFIVQSINGDEYGPIDQCDFHIYPPFYQTIWFYALCTTFLIAIVAFIYSRRIRHIRNTNRERLEKQKIQTDLLETELKALRSQMNPHFIFNSLNSIQSLILKEDTEASYDYIVLFAELVRNTLNYSNQDFIPIEKEIEFLNVYLELEKLRFKNNFEYILDEGGVEEILVPSLLIQPFIENSLLHGLMHKQGLKKLSIRFERTEVLTCVIEDNGVGRDKSKEIQKRQAPGHKSFALEAITKRLELLESQNEEKIGYSIEDLYSNGEASGTKITLVIPFQEKY
ncbi:MAG: histidine kinase [Crocinitomicaceae bacterium]|nr:histidine kinase [Crocinitomicaceae bacterium]